MSCKLNPEVRNKDGQLVESKLFSQLTSLTKDREMAKMLYAISKEPNFLNSHSVKSPIFSKLGGDINPIIFNNSEEDTNSKKVLSKILEHTEKDTDLYRLIESLSGINLKVNFEFNSQKHGDAYMYISNGDTIHLNADIISLNSNIQFVTGFLHEVVHGYTLKEYHNNKLFKTEIDNLYELAKRLSNRKDMYGFSESEEFISEIYTNPEFRDHIKTLEDNIWSIFVKLIRRLLGKENYSIYNRSLNLIDNVINLTNERAFQDQLEIYLDIQSDYGIKLPKTLSTSTLEFDENNEPTIESFAKVMDLNSLLSDKAVIAKYSKELGTKEMYFNIEEVISKVTAFNTTHQGFVASFNRENAQYRIQVETKNSDNLEVADNLQKGVQINNKLIGILNNIGFTVAVDSTLTDVHGLFDPNNAKTTSEGLKTIIRVANSLEGMQAIPEEFAHLMIEGLMDLPLVLRILKLVGNTGVVEEILGDTFDRYMELYKEDITLMKKEAAGKILSTYFKGEDLKSMDKYSNIIERLWESAKRLFRKLSVLTIDSTINEINRHAENLATQILNEEMTPLVNRELVLNAETLYEVNQYAKLLSDTTNKALFNKKKRLSIYLGRKKSKTYNEGDIAEIKTLEDNIKKEEFVVASTSFLNYALKDINAAVARMDKLVKSHGMTMDGTIMEQMYASKTLREIRDFISAYTEPVAEFSIITHTAKRLGLSTDLDMEKLQQLEVVASQIITLMNSLNDDYKKIGLSLVTNMLKPLLHSGLDVTINLGKKKGQIISVKLLLEKAEKDISYLNAWFDAASDSNDVIIALFDRVIKLAEAKVLTTHEDIKHELNKAHTILTLVHGEKNTEFMFEMSEGLPSGFFISNIDHVKFYKAKDAFYKELTSRGLSEEEMSKEMRKWDRLNTHMLEVDASIERYERVPKSVLYPSNALSKLNAALREYYDFFMKLKTEEDSKIPEQNVYKYKAIQIRADVTETALNQISHPKQAGKTLLSSVTDGWIRREDDDEFGDAPIEMDELGNPIQVKQNLLHGKGSKSVVLVDFNGKKVNRLPVYYTRMIADKERLSLDATGTLLAYSYMATHFQEMGKIVDTLELGRDVMRLRDVGQHKGNKVLTESVNALGELLQKDYVKSGDDSLIVGRLSNLLEQNVYGILKIDEGTWNVFGHEIDKAKTVDNLAAITSFTTLGLNMFSGINNVVVGKYQLFLEGVAGEHFNLKDIAIGDKNYFAGLPEVLGEIGSYKTTTKLGLITEKYNVFQDFERDAKHKDYYKNTTQRFFGKGGVLFLQSAGEHYMLTRTLLAYMNNFKLVDSSGKKISLFDAYEVVKEIQSGVTVDAKLVLKQGLKKEDGTDFTEEDVININYKVAKINQSMHGIYNNMDKGAVQRYMLGRLVIMFRKWMMPHYNRRFKGGYYDVQMDQYKEGMYRSVNHFALALINELKAGKVKYGAAWATMSDTEKANIKRATTEAAVFTLLSLTIGLLGGRWKDDETWAGRMTQYFMRRLQLEIGTSFWVPMMVTDGKTILLSPTAGMKTMENIISALRFWDAWDMISTGEYKDHSVYYKNITRGIPLYGQYVKVRDIGTKDYMFSMFNKY